MTANGNSRRSRPPEPANVESKAPHDVGVAACCCRLLTSFFSSRLSMTDLPICSFFCSIGRLLVEATRLAVDACSFGVRVRGVSAVAVSSRGAALFYSSSSSRAAATAVGARVNEHSRRASASGDERASGRIEGARRRLSSPRLYD